MTPPDDAGSDTPPEPLDPPFPYRVTSVSDSLFTRVPPPVQPSPSPVP
jgi:hypothetical protein